MLLLYHTVILHRVCSWLRGWGTRLFNRRSLIELAGQRRSRGMVLCLWMAKLCQSRPNVSRAAAESIPQLLDLLITNRGLNGIANVIPQMLHPLDPFLIARVSL